MKKLFENISGNQFKLIKENDYQDIFDALTNEYNDLIPSNSSYAVDRKIEIRKKLGKLKMEELHELSDEIREKLGNVGLEELRMLDSSRGIPSNSLGLTDIRIAGLLYQTNHPREGYWNVTDFLIKYLGREGLNYYRICFERISNIIKDLQNNPKWNPKQKQ